MCGICGLYGPEINRDSTALVQRMTDTLSHRGPDADGVFVHDGIALGHRRLAIIDLSVTGQQPMTLGETTVVYNGESYNFRQLRNDLEREGVVFRGSSDTEVLLQAYQAWGLDGLSRLEGIFAFALWDAKLRRLVLMRDRLGVKPLFYTWDKDRLVFGSEIKALLAGTEGSLTVDEHAFSEYLWYGNSFTNRTMFAGIHSLEPGHRLVVQGESSTVEPWFELEEWLEEPLSFPDLKSASQAVRKALDKSVERQLISDVPVCVFLSGGVDSSSIAAAASTRQRLQSFAVGFDFEGGVNELPKARRVADELNLDHHELRVNSGTLEEVIESLVVSHDEPFADAANIPLYLLAQKLSGSVKVALQGDGGDEMFGGYRRYAVLRYAKLWQCWPSMLNWLLLKIPGSMSKRFTRLGVAAGHIDPAMRMALLLTLETLQDPPTAALTSSARQRLESETDPFAAFRHCANRFAGVDPVQQMLLTDTTLQLPSQFLNKVDRATMAHGLEARVPLLDEKIASLAFRIPTKFKVSATEKKIVLREAMRGRLPDAILDGPKTGFGVPYGAWLAGALHEFARARILDAKFIDRFEFDRAYLERALDEHRAQHRERGFLLWKLLQLSIWSRQYLS